MTPAQCRAGRAAIGWSQQDLAEKAAVSRPVVQDFERNERVPIANNLRAIKAALEAAGVEFQAGGQQRAGVAFVDQDAD